ncbi:hypothetical protein DL96DRAFT_1553825 [Flagelloscypha sp. PMI_526]|nr:hypothetical protein DL96DRAFT_1553825 [Flagelloscypha sp. PMI_526]
MSSPFPSSNPNRASLLAGLRTGGVRPPQTAAPNVASFDPSQLQLPVQNMQNRGFMTAAFQQAVQFEMLKLQAMQAQQYQNEMLRQQQQQQQQSVQQPRRTSFNPPNTAGPTGGFDIRSPALSAQLRRPSQGDSLKPSASVDQVPMTARLDGKFATRTASMPAGTTVISGGTSLGSLASNNAKETVAPSKSDSASSWRRGGSNGNSALQALRDRSKAVPPALTSTEKRISPPPVEVTPPSAPLASAGGKRPKPLSFNLSTQKPMIPEVLIDTSEAEEDADDASSASGSSHSSHHNGSGKSSPTTSNELLTIGEVNQMPLSPREEATKKLYEGLGIAPPSPRAPSINIAPPQTAALFPSHSSGFNVGGFPQSPFIMAPVPNTASLTGPNYGQHKMDRSANQPKRQPRGPPSNTEELGPLNFAARSPRLPPSAAGLVGSMQSLVVEAY